MEQQGRRAIGRVCPRGAESYTWQEGDTAERIARTYATTVQALQVIYQEPPVPRIVGGGKVAFRIVITKPSSFSKYV